MSCIVKSNLKEDIVPQISERILAFKGDSATQYASRPHVPRMIRIGVKIDDISLLPWLNDQEISTKIYWSDRQKEFEFAGVGVADRIRGNNTVDYRELLTKFDRGSLNSDNGDIRYYGGAVFSNTESVDESWKSFGAYQFILPQFDIIKRPNSETIFSCNLVIPPDADPSCYCNRVLAKLQRLAFSPEDIPDPLPQLCCRNYLPTPSRWRSAVGDILELINDGQIEKIVLARKTLLKFDRCINPYWVLKRMKNNSPSCYHFCFQFDEDFAFIGAPPERLYRRKGKEISVEAVAGTRGRGKSREDDQWLGSDLMNSDKDQREHQFVVENLRQALTDLGCTFTTNRDVSVLKLDRVQHLFLDIDGILPQNTSDADILTTLHPTSAVAGCPTAKALQYIRSHEPFCRGWYAGPVGWLANDSAEFAVAIRSGLISGSQMNVYTGAGIVRGSKPDEEWQEMESKFDSFIGKLL